MSLCVFVTPVFVLSGKPGVQDLKGTIAALLPLTSCLPLGIRGLPLDVKGLPLTSLPRVTGRALVGSSSSCSSTAPTYTPGEETVGVERSMGLGE